MCGLVLSTCPILLLFSVCLSRHPPLPFSLSPFLPFSLSPFLPLPFSLSPFLPFLPLPLPPFVLFVMRGRNWSSYIWTLLACCATASMVLLLVGHQPPSAQQPQQQLGDRQQRQQRPARRHAGNDIHRSIKYSDDDDFEPVCFVCVCVSLSLSVCMALGMWCGCDRLLVTVFDAAFSRQCDRHLACRRAPFYLSPCSPQKTT